MVFGPFWFKTGIHFAHFGLELGMDFEETKGVDFVVSFPNEYRERKSNIQFKVDFETSFIWCSNLSNDDIFIS